MELNFHRLKYKIAPSLLQWNQLERCPPRFSPYCHQSRQIDRSPPDNQIIAELSTFRSSSSGTGTLEMDFWIVVLSHRSVGHHS
jgi:hypothetical protein